MKRINLHYFRYLLGSLLCALLVHSSAVYAQAGSLGVTVKGHVIDETDAPISYAIIGIKGTTVGATADDNGYFTITLPANTNSGDLVISSVGYTTKEVHFDGNANVEVTLAQGTKNLNEVVVIGYGTAAVKDLTGSVAVVNSKDFNQGVISSPEEMLEGKVAGVVVTPNSGMPGAGANINIRGINSIDLTSQPLIVIDGVILDYASIAGAPSPLSTIDPDNIETFTILKDPASCAIYGNRGANGVIIITTKKGKTGKFSVGITSTTGVSQVSKYVDVMNASQFRQYISQYGGATPAIIAANTALLGNSNTDWQKQIYQNALSTNNEINLTGGIKNLPYRFSFSNFDQDGVLKTGYMKRQSADLHLDPSYLNNTLKVAVNINGTHTENRFANQAAVGDAVRFDPTQSVYSSNPANSWYGYTTWMDYNSATKTYYPNPLATANPVADLNDKRDISAVNRVIANIQLEYSIPKIDGLRAIVNAGGDIAQGNGYTTVSPLYSGSYSEGGTYDSYKQTNTNKLLDAYLNYKKEFKKIKSVVDATAGYEYQDFKTSAPATITYYIPGPSGTVTPPYIPTGDSSESVWLSYYARLNYTFNNKYLLTLSDREDYSSKIAGNHGGNFYGVAVAWKINEENFLKNVKAISQLKLRLSDAQVGNANIADYQYIPNYYQYTNTAQYALGGSYYQPYAPSAYNYNIKWETVTGANAAIDYGFFNNRITGSIEVYQKKTTNLLMTAPVAALANLSNVITQNVGQLTNNGEEFSINALAVTTKDVTWNIGFNIAYNQNKITALYGEGSIINTGSISGGTGNTIQAQVVGQPVGAFWVQQQVYNSNGKPIEGLYATQANGSNLYAYKSPIPPVTLGFNTRFDYKKWDLFMSAHASIGNYAYNNNLSNLDSRNAFINSLNFISNGSMDAYNTKFANSQYLSDYYVQNASFLRMDNIVLSYNFGKIIQHKIGLIVSANCQNVFTITKYSGVNPEQAIDNNLYPLSRTYSLALKLNF